MRLLRRSPRYPNENVARLARMMLAGKVAPSPQNCGELVRVQQRGTVGAEPAPLAQC